MLRGRDHCGRAPFLLAVEGHSLGTDLNECPLVGYSFKSVPNEWVEDCGFFTGMQCGLRKRGSFRTIVQLV